jgi:DNA-binding beta-propeller fold protein YncE
VKTRGARWPRLAPVTLCVVGFSWAACSTLSLAAVPNGSLRANPLRVPGLGAVEESEPPPGPPQVHTVPLSPGAEAIAKAESSRTIRNLNHAQAAKLAEEALPSFVHDRAGGPPALPQGEKISGFAASNVAGVDFGGGKHGLIESSQPMALPVTRGHFAAIDLGLKEAEGGFQPISPDVGLTISKNIRNGVRVPRLGLSLTPTDERGTPANSEGSILGATVFYANTADTDTLVKPTTAGFELDTMLFATSPERLYFRVGLPAGVRMVQAGGRTGQINVVSEGAVVAVIRPPSATDAAGTTVPVSMSVTGNTIVLNVSSHSARYIWPLSVDPELATTIDNTISERSNWKWHPSNEAKFSHYWATNMLEMYHMGGLSEPGEYTEAQYLTQGESSIYKVEVESAGNVTKARAKLELAHLKEVDQKTTIAEKTSYGSTITALCGNAECSKTGGHQGNLASFKLEAVEPVTETYDPSGSLWNTHVYVAQEKAPEPTFNETAEILSNGRANALDGCHCTGGKEPWLGPYSNSAFEVKAHDPGIGVSWAKVVVGAYKLEEPIYEDGLCSGVQCNENYSTLISYSPGMPDGEQTILWYASNLVGRLCESCTGLLGEGTELVKVDATPPHSLEVTGWPTNREVSAGLHTLTVEATDGTAPTNSSGVKSIAVAVDGGSETVVPGTTCKLGPCTAKGSWTLAAEGLSEGVHRLTVTATDNANNVASREITFDVRHASPVSVGPGTVDPSSGQFKLSASDVLLAGTTGVSRAYTSRNVLAGGEGPLGPQWTMSIGNGEGLTVLPNGDVVVMSAGAGRTTFLRNSKGEFESPPGDSNLKVETKEAEPGKGITEYLLVNASAGTTSRFTQPPGTGNTSPAFANEFGAEGAGLKYPESEATDSSGNVWVTDFADNRIEKFAPSGVLLGSYGYEGEGTNEFRGPWGIAVNQTTGNVYVSDQGNNRIEELNSSGSFVQAMGWGVTDGKAEFEICTAYCHAGIAGSGNGQIYVEAGIAVDSTGNVWLADYGNNRVQEFNTKGEYVQKFGSAGAGEGQFNGPLNIAFSGGNPYVVDYANNRVEEFTTSGAYLSQFGKGGSGNGEFNHPRGIAADAHTGNLYVTDSGNNRVEEFTGAGKLITKFGTPGAGPGQFSEPTAVTVGTGGNIFVADYNNHRLEEWMRASWLPTISEGPLTSAATSYTYEAVERSEGHTEIEPVEALAPVPSGISCGTKPAELTRGCRALTFNYATATTATGENQSQWGDYKGNLTRVYFRGWDPAKGAMTETVVAQYSYDARGRLRAEWDPRIEHSTACGKECSALKTVYGYDSEGHVTSVTAPGQETYVLTYGTIAGDPNQGRLLKVLQAPAATPLWKGELPANTEAPKLTGTPLVGVRMLVSTGAWSKEPVAYGYQWDDCNASGGECTPITGATNSNYTPTLSDAGHILEAQVAATNGGGTVVASALSSTAIAGIATPHYVSSLGSIGTGEGQFEFPLGVAHTSSGNTWVSEGQIVLNHVNYRVQEFNEAGAYVRGFGTKGSGNGQLNKPRSLAVDSHNDLWIADTGNDRLQRFNEVGEYQSQVGSLGTAGGQFTEPAGVTVDSKGNVWAADTGNNRIEEFNEKGEFLATVGFGVSNGEASLQVCSSNCRAGIAGAGPGQFSKPQGLVAESNGDTWILDAGNSRLEELNEKHEFIRQVGSSGAGNGQFASPNSITGDSRGNLWVVDTGNKRVQAFNENGEYLTGFGVAGTGAGQFKTPFALATDSNGNFWVSDETNNAVQKWSVEAAVEAEKRAPQPGSTIEYRVPTSGAGLPNLTATETAKWGQKDNPLEGMALFPPDEPQGWPASGYKRATIRYLDAVGHAVNTATPGGGVATTEYNEINEPVRALTADNRAVALNEANPTEAAEKLDTKSTFSSEGGLLAETLGPEHKVRLASGTEVAARAHTKYFYDEGAPSEFLRDDLVTKSTVGAQYSGKEEDVRTTTTSYSGQENLGWKLRKPTSTTTDPTGLKLTKTTKYDPTSGAVVETQTPAAIGNDAGLAPANLGAFGKAGTEAGQVKEPKAVALTSSGNVLVLDSANSRVEEFTAAGAYNSLTFGTAGTGNGQLKLPYAIATDAKGNVWIADTGNNRVEEFSSKGAYLQQFGKEGTAGGQFKEPKGISVEANGNVFVADGANNRIEKFSEKGAFEAAIGWGVSNGEAKLEVCTSGCRAGIAGSGNGQLSAPRHLAVTSGGNVWVAEGSNHRVQEFSEAGEYVNKFGSSGNGHGQFQEPRGVALEPGSGNIWVSDAVNNTLQEFTGTGSYITTTASKGTGKGQFEEPWGIAVGSTGNMYVADVKNSRISRWAPTISGNPGAHDTQTIFYSAASNAKYPACGEHAEWANLPCETQPANQPASGGLPELPVDSFAYNVWDEVETTTEKFGATTRTEKQTYDEAGRAVTSEEASTVDKALPKVTNEYNPETGALVKQSTTTEGKTQTLTSVYNTLGQRTSYTDADGSTTTFEFEKEGDARLAKMSFKIGTETVSQQYVYDATIGTMSELVDSSAGASKVTRDAEGKILTETYPNAMTATHTYNAVGQQTSVQYTKTAHCATTCPETWVSDTIVPSIHGETLTQTSTLAKDNYTYDNAGRLSQTQEEPTGKGCVTRIYSYDEEGNRATLTSREPNSEKRCATEGGATEYHTYDTANRPTDAGLTYEALGNTTKVPAEDAGGHEITSSYYVDGQVASQTQNSETANYSYDPAGRTRETVSTGTSSGTVITHYAAPGEASSWVSESGEKWTRNIPGIDGSLEATQASGAAAVLQLHDLQGNVIATAAVSETETKLLSTYNSTEFGVPQPSTVPPKYAWLGATGLATEPAMASGISTNGGASYVPQVARNLQTAPVVPPGAFPNGQGAGSPYSSEIAGWFTTLSAEESAATLAEYAAEQRAEALAALRAATEDPHEYKVEEQNELRALAAELEQDAELVQKDAWILEVLPGSSGFAVGAAAGTAVSAYYAMAITVASGLRYLANVTEQDWYYHLFPRRYLIETFFVNIKNVGDIFHAERTSFKIIYDVNDWYCKNEGVWGEGEDLSDYKTYYNCGEAGIWGIPGAFM